MDFIFKLDHLRLVLRLEERQSITNHRVQKFVYFFTLAVRWSNFPDKTFAQRTVVRIFSSFISRFHPFSDEQKLCYPNLLVLILFCVILIITKSYFLLLAYTIYLFTIK